jgi:ketosteroid isomerase-like protein
MSQETERERVEAFYRALCAQDYAAIESFLDDDATWSIGGPVDALPFCGLYRGKARIRHVLEHKVAETLGRRKIVPDYFLADGNRGALLGRLVGRLPGGQTIAYRAAQFFVMHDRKVREVQVLLDSFDAAEQVMGRRLGLAQERDQARDTIRDETQSGSIVPV